MNEAGFRAWLEANYGANTVATKLSEARQLAKAYGDLDILYDEDGLASVMESLRYSAADKAENRPNPSKVPLTSDLYRDLSNLRTTINYYRNYRAGEARSGSGGGGVMTDDEILQRFSGKSGFKEWCAGWSSPDRAAFFRVARALHNAGVDWYHVNLDRQVRCGRKKQNALDANEVFMVLSTIKGSCWVRKPADRTSLGLPEVGVSLSQFADAIEAHPESLDRFVGGTGYWPDELSPDSATADEDSDAGLLAPMVSQPTNLILYGPPGTGKTYATAAEAVRLCGEAVPDDRDKLMQLYRSLHQKGRIAFVTFHQNFSYEDFVEGLRPVTSSQGDDPNQSVGFSLQPQDGIFKLIADLAASNRGKAVGDAPVLDRSRKIFKMSLGRSWASEDDAIYQDAIRGGYVVLGWGGEVDWSDPRYDAWESIKERWRQDHPDASGNDPNMSQMYTFRIGMQIGSLVVISDGNRKFRAVGEITGPYQFVPGPNGEYNHRRAVRWLWRSEESLPRELIYEKELSQVSAYQMNSRHVNWDGLEQIVAGGDDANARGAPESFVLIIDEINRANISKVFGELITLIETDKRLGMLNALTVRLPYSKQEFGVPANLHIIGTMNTADRSIALLDTALRRRFDFRELAPDAGELPEKVGDIPLRRVLEVINDRIEYLIDREHRIGHAFFLGRGGRDREAIDATMRNKVIPLLQEYFFEDWSRVASVLGEKPRRGGAFLLCRELSDPTGSDGEKRESWSVLPRFADDAYDRLIGKAPILPDAVAEESAE